MTRRELVWAATVGVVLADSSVVTLALPDILRELDTSVLAVSWVLTSFNVVLAVAVLPAALAAARGGVERAAQAWVAGVVVFGLASLVCAVAPGLGVLLAGRCLQALGGAFVVAGAIELLARSRGSHARAAAVWGAAGLAGLAIGPAAGGLLTELITWEAIFVVQVPVLAAAAVAARPPSGAAERGRAGRIDVAPELALGLVSAGLTGALFLLVVMLTEGWGHSPLEAALIVTAMPVATVAASFAARGRAGGRAAMAAGAVALAGGLAALGLLPEASPAWTLAPQALVGAGIALVLPGLTGLALGGADPAGRRAAGTVAARHAGIVVGLLLLTPLFTGELTDQQRAAERSGTALLLDADLPPRTKIELGAAIARRVDQAGGRLPDVSPAFRAVTPPAGSRAEFERLERRLVDEVDRAATHAFSTVFLVAGGLALLAVVPIALAGGTAPRRRTGLVVLGGRGRRLRGGHRRAAGERRRELRAAACRRPLPPAPVDPERRAPADRPVRARRRGVPAAGHARGARAGARGRRRARGVRAGARHRRRRARGRGARRALAGDRGRGAARRAVRHRGRPPAPRPRGPAGRDDHRRAPDGYRPQPARAARRPARPAVDASGRPA